MNKFTRFTLFAGLMAFGLVACGDDVQIVEPEPPPPPALVVSLQPGTVAINVGQTVDLAINVSGGDASIVPTVSCSASNSAVTVTTVGMLCRVVGVTEGEDATVTVAVTRGTQSATAGANVTVREDTEVPATVAIEKVTQGSLNTPVALNNIQRQIEVTVRIVPGTQTAHKVTLLFRGAEIASQELTPADVAALAAAAAEAPDAQAPALDITFSWETDAYSVTADAGAITGASTATPNHLNGTGALQARLDVDDGSATGTAVNSQSMNLTLRNLNGFHLKIARTGSTNTALDVQNFEWRGGIDLNDPALVGAGLDAHLIPVIYTPGVTLASAQFTFAGLLRTLTAGPWTYIWTPAALAGYTMPVLGTAAQPNMLRDGEYPQVIGNAVLSDGQGMGPFGGPLDCLGAPIGILNIEISATGLCLLGTAWSPPSATLVAANNQTLDPLRTGERIDNAAPTGQTFTLSSRPGLPDWPQIPTTGLIGDVGAFVNALGTWVNEGIAFNNAGIHNKTAMVDLGVSRVVAGFPAPTFLASVYMASGGTLGAAPGVDITATPTGASLPETNTPSVYTVTATDADELNNSVISTLSGDGPDADLLADDPALLGSDQTDPFLQHTAAISNPDRDAFDLATLWAGSGAVGDQLTAPSSYNYFLNWTDPITVGASGFTAFGGNPVWRQVHRVTPAATTAALAGTTGTAVPPAWGPGVTNYGRFGASQQPVTAESILNGYYIFRAYVLDDAGNASRDQVATGPTTVGTISYESAAIRRQALVDGPAAAGQPTVFGITAPIAMTGGSTVTFSSNAQDNLDLGQSFLSLDYLTFLNAGYWAANSTAGAPNAAGGYWSPVATLAPIQGTTGGVRHGGAESEHGVIFNTPFETTATIVATTALTRNVTGFIRSIEWVCAGAGVPHAGCGAAPVNWVGGIDANLQGATPVGWFAPPSAAADLAYAANRPMTASFSQFDGTRFDHVPRTSGNINYNLEQIAPDDATSPFPHRSVSTAAVNPVSVLLNGGLGTEVSVYHTELNGGSAAVPALSNGWAIQSATASFAAPAVTARPVGAAPVNSAGRTLNVTITARLISGSSTVVTGGPAGTTAGPGQNLFPGPLGRVDFFVLEPGTGTLRYLGSQNNPVVFENHPLCVAGAPAVTALYRCWDFTNTFSLPNFVRGLLPAEPVQVLAIGVNAAGDGLATYPIDAL